MSELCINVGCGMSPTRGWRNYDNSPSIRLAKRPFMLRLMAGLGLVGENQLKFISFIREHQINYADAARGLPLAPSSVQVVYSCHMLEHLDPKRAREFLQEAWRVLQPGGILRIAVPDLRRLVDDYLEHGDADRFVEKLHMHKEPPRGLRAKLRYLYVGDRQHQWQYDARSLCAFVEAAGFVAAVALKAGETTIPAPGDLNLSERVEESLYVEAKKPE